jgi:hypothetical protein
MDRNGTLNRDKFNDALYVLEHFNCKRLRDTPLGKRLFKVLDGNGDGVIGSDEWN